jgi:ribonuclease Z
MIMRLALDQGHLPVPVHYPVGGEEHFHRLRFATAGQEQVEVDACPVVGPGVVHAEPDFVLRAAPLRHRVETVGYRLDEPDGRHFVPARLEALGVEGPEIGRLEAEGSIVVDGRTVTVDEVTVPRPGQSFAYVLDTAWCDGALELAAGVDLLLCESTFLSTEEDLAERYGHLTARQAGRLAAEAGVRVLVLTHFSPRYGGEDAFADEAAEEFGGEIVLASDFDRIPLSPRR